MSDLAMSRAPATPEDDDQLELHLGAGEIGTWEWDLATGAVQWSDEMYRLHGIERGAFGGTPEDYIPLVHPDDAEAVAEIIEHLLAGGPSRPLEYRIRQSDGEIRHMLGTNQTVHDADHQVCTIVGTVRDISELRQGTLGNEPGSEPRPSESHDGDALRRSEDRFRALIENSQDVISVFGADGTALYVTPSVTRVLGYDPDELIGRPGLEIVHPDDAESATRAFERAFANPGEVVPHAHRVRHRDGSYRHVEITGTNLLRHPAVGGMVANLHDVTERHEVQAAIERSEAQYRNLVEQAVFGIYRSTVDGRILSVNPALVTMVGFESAEDLLAVKMESLYEDPNERARLIAEHGLARSRFSLETSWRHRTGRPIRVRLSGRRMFLEEIGSPGFEVFVEDISEQRAMEAALLQAKKMEAIGRLAGGVAHDFNNILTVILGEVEIAIGDIDSADPKEESLLRVRSAAERAGALTRQLLSFSRKELISRETLQLNELVLEASQMLARLIEENVHLDLRLGDEVWPIRADAAQLEQVLVNLAVNARDSMPNGGTLGIETGNETVGDREALRHAGLRAGEYVVLTVRDTGLGMSEEVLAHVFEPFFTTKGEKGTGLGLATCYSVVKQHDGYITVASRLDAGTTVKMLLPRFSGRQESEEERRSAESADGGSETILVVEDEDEVRSITARMLEKAGYSVLTAADGAEARHLVELRGEQIDLLVCDVVLPRVSGRQLAQEILSTHPAIRVLFVTGYTDDSTLRRGFDERTIDLIQKPFTGDQLAGAVRRILDGGRAGENVS